ncbi:hypothetical protein ACFOSC_07205 [Streptantibioticus rubrisoli]|uniref:Uncharacterized protein n=1 Tax=Streptantibioticus rubrisoli TaxID=1387313 RepID=A0ABT1P9P3_9ACTN|nr:hypothetical protein [Streptantibioticus rubrisoli]MCQ4041148.1 hypothetical protein [Streptantibioticus rubrisoli]
MNNVRRITATVTASALLALGGAALATPSHAQTRTVSTGGRAATATMQSAPAVSQILRGASYLLSKLL